MSKKTRKAAAREARELAGLVWPLLPPGCGIDPGDLAAAMYPVGVRLVRLRRKARDDGAAAEAYRVLCAEVGALIGRLPESRVLAGALPRTVPFDPVLWNVALVPDPLVRALEAA